MAYEFHVNEPNEIGKKKDKISSKELKMAKNDINESIMNEHTITFSKDEMTKLHADGQIVKTDPDGKEHTYVYKESVYEVEGKEGKMAKYDTKEIAQDSVDVFKMIDVDTDLPEWVEAKITIAAHNMNTVKDYLTHHMKESVNEAGMEMGKLKDAILMFQKKIKKQGRITNARDADHLERLIKLYKQMGGKGVKEGKFTVDFDIGSPGIMSQTVDAKNAKEAVKKVAGGIKGKVKIKKVYKTKPIKLKSKSGMGKISHLGIESVKEKLGMGDEYVGTARIWTGAKAMLYRSNEADKWSIGKKHGIKKWDYYLLVKGESGTDYIVDTGTKILRKAGKWAQGYIKRKLSGTGKERFS